MCMYVWTLGVVICYRSSLLNWEMFETHLMCFPLAYRPSASFHLISEYSADLSCYPSTATNNRLSFTFIMLPSLFLCVRWVRLWTCDLLWAYDDSMPDMRWSSMPDPHFTPLTLSWCSFYCDAHSGVDYDYMVLPYMPAAQCAHYTNILCINQL